MAGITLGILAGGRGARLGGVDKALLEFRGQRLLDRSADSFADPADSDSPVLLSRAGDGVAATVITGFQNVPDLRSGALGPLAGLEALLAATRTRWLLTTPVDLCDVPSGLGPRLRACSGQPLACVVRDVDGLQPLVALWPVRTSLPAVRRALDAGRLSVHGLLGELPHVELDIRPERLGNLNRTEDFPQA
jgi:molybdopterin-guanine dinucleotide biosynthesis protein A